MGVPQGRSTQVIKADNKFISRFRSCMLGRSQHLSHERSIAVWRSGFLGFKVCDSGSQEL